MIPLWLFLIVAVTAVISYISAFLFGRRLAQWEHRLQGARLVIAYKGRNKMTPRLLDFLTWANQLDSDKALNGQVIYKLGGTTIAIIKPSPKEHGKTETKTIKEKAA